MVFKKGNVPHNKGKKGYRNVGTFEKGQTRGHYPKGRPNIKLKETRKRKWWGMIGENNPSWKGGIYSLSRQIRLSRIYERWRLLVLERDNFTCLLCKKVGIGMHVHHIIEFKDLLKIYEIKSYEDALKCPMIWNIDNGQTLCQKCHEEIHFAKEIIKEAS